MPSAPAAGSRSGTAAAPGGTGRDRDGRAGGPGGAASVDQALVTLLQSAGTTWSAATVSAQSGAGLALASGTTVMSIGGFTGSDPAPTLEQFQAHVAAGEVRYFVGGGFGGGFGGAEAPAALPGQAPAPVWEDPRSAEFEATAGPGGGRGGSGSAISTWVEENFTPLTVGTQTVYDLTRPRS